MTHDKDFLKNLNTAQRQAVEKIFGSVLVIAGPGTGKTQMLTARIANILSETDTNPENILCLTFTDSASVEMRNRLQKWIGPLAYKVQIVTFHAFCEKVIQNYPDLFFSPDKGRCPKGRGVLSRNNNELTIADDLDKALTFRKVIDSTHWKVLKPFNDNYLWQRSFLSAISHLKRENITPDQLKEELIPKEKERLDSDPGNFYQKDTKYGKKGEFKPSTREKIDGKIEKMYELVEIWKAYEQEFYSQGFYDFDDQIRWVVEKIAKDQGLKSDLQEKFQFILVDEYQDTNSAQNQIIWHLTDFFEDPNLFAVGDDDQSIYRFQGASLENILEFRKHFPKTEMISLTQNYRSAQKVLDGAFASVGKNLERIDHEKMLHAAGDNQKFEGKIEKATFPARFSELIFLAEKIQSEIKSSTKPAEIAILVRENKEVKEITEHLQKFKIPVATKIAENIFEDQNVKFLIQMLKIFDNPTLDHEFYELLHAPFFDISAHELYELSIATEGGRKRLSKVLFSPLDSRGDVLSLSKDRGDCPDIQNVHKLFVQANKELHHLPPHILAERLFHRSGMAKHLGKEDNPTRIPDLLKIRKFIEWIEKSSLPPVGSSSSSNLPEVLKKIDLHQELNIPIFPDPTPTDNHAVQIMTAHKSKGQEFEIVFLPGLLDKTWGNPRKKTGLPLPELFVQDHDVNEDERRLFFVALTRAKKKIVLSYAEKDFSGRDRAPSQFWHEIPDDLCDELKTETLHAKAQELLPVFFSTPETPQLTNDEKAILKKLAENYIWSATSLQNFIDCPRKFLYLNLLRIPTPKNKFLGFGSATHEALQHFFEQFKSTEKLPDKLYLLEQFEVSLKKQNLTSVEYENALHHGKELLGNYFEVRKAEFHSNAELEFNFRKFGIKIDGIPVTGKIDKIEFSSPDSLNEATHSSELAITSPTPLNRGIHSPRAKATFIDYKTGKPKKIEHGKRLWRQLVFYDLLARNVDNLGWKADNFVLEFLTPDTRGNLVQESLEITDEDRAQVLAELKDANEKLQNLDFPMVENPEQDLEIDYWQGFGK